jgi:hypothetical protein
MNAALGFRFFFAAAIIFPPSRVKRFSHGIAEAR